MSSHEFWIAWYALFAGFCGCNAAHVVRFRTLNVVAAALQVVMLVIEVMK